MPEPLDQRLGDGAPVAERGELRASEEGRAAVGVHRDHGARALDSGDVLARARDAEGEVELGRDRAPALADLALPRDPAEIDGHAASAHRGAQEIGEHLQLAEAVGAAHAAAAGDDALGVAQIDGAGVGRHHAAHAPRARGAVGRGGLAPRPDRGAGGGPGRRRARRGGASPRRRRPAGTRTVA